MQGRRMGDRVEMEGETEVRRDGWTEEWRNGVRAREICKEAGMDVRGGR